MGEGCPWRLLKGSVKVCATHVDLGDVIHQDIVVKTENHTGAIQDEMGHAKVTFYEADVQGMVNGI